jgi:hypothetical protein
MCLLQQRVCALDGWLMRRGLGAASSTPESTCSENGKPGSTLAASESECEAAGEDTVARLKREEAAMAPEMRALKAKWGPNATRDPQYGDVVAERCRQLAARAEDKLGAFCASAGTEDDYTVLPRKCYSPDVCFACVCTLCRLDNVTLKKGHSVQSSELPQSPVDIQVLLFSIEAVFWCACS